MYPIHFQKELNDFDILYKHDCIVFAGNTSKWFSYNFTLDRMMSSYNPSSDNDITTKSNVLCIATDDSLVMPDIVFAGHRDGGITIHDYRTKKVTGAMLSCNSRKSEHEFGSVVAMQLLFDQRPEQLLVRGSNGTYCRLFDIRCLGSLPSASPFTKNTRACAFEFCLPSTVLQEHTLSMTKGFATNPLRSTVMIPYFDSSNQNPSFGLWSLDSGEFIGNKPVKCWNSKQTDIMEPLSATTIKPLECLELCSKLTRAYAWSAPSGEKPDEDTEKRVRTIPGCFGLWLDWGLNGVHHVVCHGRL